MAAYKEQPIDWVKAAILERMNADGYTQKDVCEMACISGNTFSELMHKPFWAWGYEYRKSVLAALKIRIADFPTDVQMIIAQQMA